MMAERDVFWSIILLFKTLSLHLKSGCKSCPPHCFTDIYEPRSCQCDQMTKQHFKKTSSSHAMTSLYQAEELRQAEIGANPFKRAYQHQAPGFLQGAFLKQPPFTSQKRNSTRQLQRRMHESLTTCSFSDLF